MDRISEISFLIQICKALFDMATSLSLEKMKESQVRGKFWLWQASRAANKCARLRLGWTDTESILILSLDSDYENSRFENIFYFCDVASDCAFHKLWSAIIR